jgi:predicted protein tyrosine phosphatase
VQFIVASRSEIERGIVVRTPYVVISITDPGTRRARIRRPTGIRGVLHVQFHDAVPVKGSPLPADVVLVTKEHAKRIWAFVFHHQGQVGTVVVQCEQGMSRSPAVAAALCTQLGSDSARFFQEYQPNDYVYSLMKASLGDGAQSLL